MRGRLLPALLTMLVIGPLNFVLYKVLFSLYGGSRFFFVMQGVNFLYVVYGGVVLAWLRHTREIPPDMDSLPRRPFAVMAGLDCLGGLCAAMGAAAVAGQLQMLLNQSLVPCTMVASTVFLGTRYPWHKCVGAAIILLGALVVVAGLPSEGHSTLASTLVYWGSNVPMALSAVYKEHRFDKVHVMYLTQQVSIYQFFFGFLFAPAQAVPGVATPDGVPLADVARIVAVETRNLARRQTKTLLLLGYVLANFVLNSTGLYVTKHGSAALTAIAYSILLPCTTLAFALPCLGPFQEPLRLTTLAGLVIVMAGFALYEFFGVYTKRRVVVHEAAPLVVVTSPTAKDSIDAFHERIVLLQVPILRKRANSAEEVRSPSRTPRQRQVSYDDVLDRVLV